MARKKITKNTKMKKSTAKQKRNNKSNAVSLIAKMEKDFRDLPSKLIAQFQKEGLVQKTLYNKLNNSLKIAQKKLDSIKTKFATLVTKSKNRPLTAAIRKQVKTIEQSYEISKKAVANLMNQIEQAKQGQTRWSDKAAQLVWLKKQIAALAKQPWKNVKAPAKTTKPARQKSAASSATPAVASTSDETLAAVSTAESVEFSSN